LLLLFFVYGLFRDGRAVLKKLDGDEAPTWFIVLVVAVFLFTFVGIITPLLIVLWNLALR
jgi:hypothetical protein